MEMGLDSLIQKLPPDGDVEFLVGPDKLSMKTHSRVLRIASKVFKTMLSPKWNQDQEISYPANTKTVPLPDDFANSMLIIFLILHHCNHSVPRHLSPSEIFNVAIMADKYDLQEAVQPTLTLWFTGQDATKMSTDNFASLLTSAYLLKYETPFTEWCLKLVLYGNGSLLTLITDKDISQFLPPFVPYLLQERRMNLSGGIENLIKEGYELAQGCSTNTHMAKYAALQAGSMSTLMFKTTVAERLEKAELVWSQDEKRTHAICGFCKKSHTTDAVYFKPKLDELLKRAKICLQCPHPDDSKCA